MQLIYHFIGFVTVIALLHFIFIEIQHLIHLKNGDSLQGSSTNSFVRPNSDRSKLIRDINSTLIGLKDELRKIEPAKSKTQSQMHTNPKMTLEAASPDSKIESAKEEVARVAKQNLRAVIFTMDCIASYEQNSKTGGAAGELIIRRSLEEGFKRYNIPLRIIRSDEEFATCNMDNYDIILLDSWTWAAKGWVPKRNIANHENKIYILDFFGSSKLRSDSLHISMRKQVLTAFKSPWNTFLGYFIAEDRLTLVNRRKVDQGIIWGKDPKYFNGHELMLSQVANKVKLVSTATQTMFRHRSIEWRGHQTNEEWLNLLASSKFLLGLGHPLLGPSAVDAVSLGCMFINPIYTHPQLEAKYRSQHAYIEEVAPEYVCSYQEDNIQQLLACVDKALSSNLKPFIPNELRKETYLDRIHRIFNL